MKLLLTFVAAVFTLSGCATSPNTTERDWQKYYADRNPSSVPLHGCIAKVGPDCRAKIMWHCPQSFVDSCYTPGSTGKHECVSRNSAAECALRVSMTCPQGFDDGCNNGSSQNHQCMPTAGGDPCSIGALVACPEGFHDLCDQYPNQ